MNRADSWSFPLRQSKDPVEDNHRFGVTCRRGNAVEDADLAGSICPGSHCRHQLRCQRCRSARGTPEGCAENGRTLCPFYPRGVPAAVNEDGFHVAVRIS